MNRIQLTVRRILIKAFNLDQYYEDKCRETYNELLGNYKELKANEEELLASYEELQSAEEELNEQNEQLRNAKEILQQKELLLNESQKVARLGHYVHNIKKSSWECSDMLNEIFGIDKSYLKDVNSWLQIIHPVHRKEMSEYLLNHVYSQKLVFDKEYRIIRISDQEERWVHGLGNLKLNADGIPIELFGTIQDITERKNTENELNENRELLSFALDATNDGIWDVQLKTNSVYMSPRGCEILGYDLEEMDEVVKVWSDLVHPHDLSLTNECLQAHINGEIPIFEVEQRLRMKSGDWKWILTKGKVVSFDAEGSPLRMTGTHTDISARKLAEQALDESEEKYRNLVEVSIDAIFIYESDVITYLNQSAIKLFGAEKADQIIGKSPYQLFHPDFHDSIQKRIKAMVEQNIYFPIVEEKIIQLDGKVLDVEVAATPFKYKGNQAVLVIIRNITERKRAEENLEENQFALKQQNEEYLALNEELSESNRRIADINQDLIVAKEKAERSEIRLRSTLDNMLEGCQIIGFDWCFIYINHAAEIHNKSLKENFLGRNYISMWPGIETTHVFSLIKDCMDQRVSHTAINEFIYPDGEHAWFELSIEPVPEGVFILTIDITERKLTEIQLRENNKLIENFFNCTIGLLCIANLDGTFLKLNKEWENVLQFSLDELEGKKFLDFIHPDDIEATMETITTLANQNSVIDFTNRYLCKDGSYKLIEWKSAPLGDKIFAAARDITESVQKSIELTIAKEKAEESDQLKTAFLHNISHEIRTPMNAIVGFSDFLNKPDLLPHKKAHFIDIIKQSCNQLLSIITDIVNIATIDAGQARLEPNEVDVNSILNLLYQQFLIKAQKQNNSLHLNIGLIDTDSIILTDEVKLTEILANLIGNAIKFSKKGDVNFGYRLKKDFLEFYVEDTGIGIPVNMQEEIFKRFRQVESTTERQYGGFGLGLSISKAYVELLGGKIWLTSEPEKGSTFFFTVPYDKVKQVSIHQNNNSVFKLKAEHEKTILIAEDEESNFLLIEELLLGVDVKILRAMNGIEAIETCILNPHIDLVLMDIKMPLMDGYEAAKQIKAIRPNLPIIAQTAYSRDSDRVKAIECGCVDAIIKPISQELFIAKINEYLT